MKDAHSLSPPEKGTWAGTHALIPRAGMFIVLSATVWSTIVR